MRSRFVFIVGSVFLVLSIVLTAVYLLRAEDSDLVKYYDDFLYRGAGRDTNEPVVAKMDRKLTFVAVNATKEVEQQIISILGSLPKHTGMPLRYGSVREQFNAFIVYSDDIPRTYRGSGQNFIKSFLKNEDLYRNISSELSGGDLCYQFILYRGGYVAGGILFVDNRVFNTSNRGTHAKCLLRWALGLYGFEQNEDSNIHSVLAQGHLSELTAIDEAAIKDFYSRDIPFELPISKFLELRASDPGM